MPTFEETCEKVFSGKSFSERVLIGGLLSFVPILNICVLGYLFRYSENVRWSGNFNLPAWNIKIWKGLFLDGLRFLLLLVVFFALPSLLGWLATLSFSHLIAQLSVPVIAVFWVPFVFLTVLSFLPMALTVFLGGAATVAGLYIYQTRNRFEDLLNLNRIFLILKSGWKRILYPALAFTGLMIVGLPLAGFAFFLGFALTIAYYNLVFLVQEKERKEEFSGRT